TFCSNSKEQRDGRLYLLRSIVLDLLRMPTHSPTSSLISINLMINYYYSNIGDCNGILVSILLREPDPSACKSVGKGNAQII
ncbi:hypothetical protein ACVWYG_003149, partial [Pedobacter sp. UYEF25]